MAIDIAGEFAGRVALVTGGGSGIGAAVAQALAERGAAVGVVDLDLAAAQAVAARIGPLARPLRANVTEPAEVEAAVSAVVAEFGGLHLALNSAGVGGCGNLVADIDDKAWQQVIDVNLTGTFFCLRRQIPEIVAAGGGSIVNVTSLGGWRACPRMGAYVAAKHAVLGLTRTAALEYAGLRVRINAIAPGPVDTPMLAGLDEPTRAHWNEAHPLGRMAAPADVVSAALFLLSDRAAFLTGVHHPIDGGLGLL
ncbi:MAG: SDR family NAD(P)-dependent oxidoreductase [Sporichthyaceae bacterium]